MEFTNEKEKMSYTIGLNMAEYLTGLPVDLDCVVAAKAITDYANGKSEMAPDEYHANMQAFQQMMQEKMQANIAAVAAKNKVEGDKFHAENSKADGVVTTASGLQYIVLEAGDGKTPSATDTVRVHYTGSLLDGKVFDSSVMRGEPAQFGVNQVIPGWSEALQLMTVGSKYKLFLPGALAYGERGAGEQIPPNATLVFEVELLDIVSGGCSDDCACSCC